MTKRDQRIIQAWREGDDETFLRELALNNIERAFRPRDEFDMDVPPDSFRGSVLAYHDAWDGLPRWLRFLGRIMTWRPCR